MRGDSNGTSTRAPKGTAHVVVIGGGLAGCAAATVLAERGIRVTVVERESFLGGRAGAWQDQLADGTPFHMERGFHAFFRHYYNLRALIARVDPALQCLTPLEDYPLIGPDGWTESFAKLPRRAPLNVMALVWRTPSMKLSDLPAIAVKAVTEMVSFDPEGTYARQDRRTAESYLDSLNFPDRARRMLFDVFAHSFFNPENRYSAGELLAMFHYYFLGNPEGLVFDTAREPFSAVLWTPLQRYLEARGVTFLTETSAVRIEQDGARFAIGIVDRLGRPETLSSDACVLAVTVPALQGLLEASPSLGDDAFRSDVRALEVTLPFIVWRLWLDRPMRPDRAPFAGTCGIGLLDNISIYEKLEGESAAWAQRTGGSIVELHAYGVDDTLDEAEIRRSLMTSFHEVYPEAKEAKVLEERYLARRDCPAFQPGSHARRPGVETGIPGLFLAGDFVKLPFPSALMERAVTTGFEAANAIARTLGRHEEPIRTIPRRGLLAPFVPAKWLSTPST